MIVSSEIKGLKETQAKMLKLSGAFTHKIVGSAIYKAAKPMEDAAKQNIRDHTGNLKKSIGRVRVPLAKAREIGMVKLGPRVRGQYKGFHGHLVEFGHRLVVGGSLPGNKARNPARQGKGRVIGRVKPYAFLAPAYRAKSGVVMSNVARNMNVIINRFIKTGRIAEI